jgi:ribosome-associated protein
MAEPIRIARGILIPDAAVAWRAVRSSGPGGQNVNKVASKAVLRWRTGATTAAIPPGAMARMRIRFPSRFTAEGDVLVQSQQYRDQERNREDCLAKLAEMIRGSLVEPRPRKATKPTKGSQRRRLADKRHRSERKRRRRASDDD